MAAVISQSPSSHVSLISLDPAMASHITRTMEESVQPVRSANPSNLAKPKAAHTDRSIRHGRNASMPTGHDRKGSNGLRRVKNSTEILRQRSTKTAKKSKHMETMSDTREGRNFTITNVGVGGMLHLR